MYCNNCGYPNPAGQSACGACGTVMAPEPHISDVTSGNVVICWACHAANINDSIYCRECGRRLYAAKIPARGVNGDFAEAIRQDISLPGEPCGDAVRAERREEARAAAYETNPPSAETSALPSTAPKPPNILLEKLDMMERELDAKKQEPLPEPEREAKFDKLREYDETLKDIAFRLDTLISDLLKAEAQEYSFSDSPRVDGKSFAKNGTNAKRDPLKKKSRNLQYVIVLIALIAAIFLVGMTFGLWGSYFFVI